MMDEETDKYLRDIEDEVERTYSIARECRARGLDPYTDVEAMPAGDLAARVEGLVGPDGIADKIRELGRDNLSDIIDTILDPAAKGDMKRCYIEQAVRTALAIATEGVVAAPLEGVSKVDIRKNPDGSEYVSIYFTGPIRSAGGSAQGIAVMVGDYAGKKYGLQEYRPTTGELERYVEEIKLYNERVSRLQYLPSDDEVRSIVRNLPVCVDGDPTEEREVSVHRDLSRVETNRIRGGMCLVIAEGVAQKAKKMLKLSRDFNLDWGWLKDVGKERKEEDKDKSASKFMEEVVGGRPIFAAPSTSGGFRLRYGRNRASGIAGKSMHPATMVLLDDFVATGTQVKVERPGKGCIITECSSIEGPVVKLDDGSVVRVDTVEKAREVRDNLKEILYLGDLLVSYGDFLQTNTALVPSGYVEEWWIQEARTRTQDIPEVTSENMIEFSIKYDVPLHPRYTLQWSEVTVEELRELVEWLKRGGLDESRLVLDDVEAGLKRTLELLAVEHTIREKRVEIREYLPLTKSLGLEINEDGVDDSRFKEIADSIDENTSGLELVQKIAPYRVRAKTGAFIGCRMGRPEKARERKMEPPVHSLFPISNYGGRERSINAAAEKTTIQVEAARMKCPNCNTSTVLNSCPNCGSNTEVLGSCISCSWTGSSRSERCPRCGKEVRHYTKQHINIRQLWDNAIEKIGRVTAVKGVKGMISSYKIPEPIEKGLLRALNEVYVFKDGTIRFDATDAPLTHFKPNETNTSIERLNELGYTKDYLGHELENEDQIVELKVQDIIVAENGLEYLYKTSNYIDQLLTKFYNKEPFYNASKREDLIGQLVIGLAPHTSAGIVGRIIGYTKARVCFAHPYWHAAKRRNCDGDEDAFMLLTDVLLNFSRRYLPEKRGGKMDAPLVITKTLDPNEVDDESHKIEIVKEYPLEFYEKTLERENPSNVRVKTAGSLLGSNPYRGLLFTHDTGDITGPVTETRYVTLKSMKEKVDAQLAVAEKIRAIDECDVAELVINSHFLRDTYGNLRAYTRQKVRCVKCNHKYRRIPLRGVCTKCGGKLILTVSEGNIRKYLETSQDLADKYNLSNYLKQRLALLERDINSLFINDLNKQASLSDYM